MKRTGRPLSMLLLTVLAVPATSTGELVESRSLGCGTEETHLAIALAKHEAFERRRARERKDVRMAAASASSQASPSAVSVRRVGHVAVVDDRGTMDSRLDLIGGRALIRRRAVNAALDMVRRRALESHP